MGVAGTVGLLSKRGHAWSRRLVLRDTNVVLDITNGLYWAVKKQLLERWSSAATHQMDLYGTSMIELGSFYRDLLRRLTQRKCKVFVVYDGCRMSESTYGELASKTRHLTRSSEGSLNRLLRGHYNTLTSLPDLANNCIKEIVNEFGLGAEQLHQATYEVYPVLERLAREHRALVLTSHSDFIFSELSPEWSPGFAWLEELTLPGQTPGAEAATSSGDWEVTVYSHGEMLRHFGLEAGRGPGQHSGALNCLRVLMRDDFAEQHTHAVNRVLELAGTALELPPRNRPDRRKTQRLIWLLEHWPRARLTTSESVRDSLLGGQGARGPGGAASSDLMRDFDALHQSYTRCFDFESSEVARAFTTDHSQDQARELCDALLRRESTAEFLASAVRLTDFRRTNIQDTDTFRSTFSLVDRAVQYLVERTGTRETRVFDRQQATMRFRSLDGANQGALLRAPLTQESLFVLFHFNEAQRDILAARLNETLQLDGENANRLALLLLLARFALKLTPRGNYDNTDQLSPSSSSTSSSSSRSSRSSSRGRRNSRAQRSESTGEQTTTTTQSRPPAQPDPPPGTLAHRYHRREVALRYYTAILNSFVYHLGRLHQGDQAARDVPADIRVARQKIETLARDKPQLAARHGNQEYITCKHLVEALNSTLHGYKELNSLYNFPGPNLLVNKYYDGVLIYKLMSRMSNTLAGFLLRLDEELERELCEF